MSNDQLLIQKLDTFIRKYYKNRLIRGIIFLLAISAGFYLLLILPEYFFHFGPVIRAILFFSYVLISGFLLIRLIIVPVMQLLRIGKTISHEKASEIIGEHFLLIQDKLLNTLQLIRQKGRGDETYDLLDAAIEQKIKALHVFKFTKAINFTTNIRYLKFVVPPVAIILLLLVFSPQIISEPTRRIVSFNKAFVKPFPFSFELLNKNLKAMQQEDFELKVKFKGEEIPAEVYLNTAGVTFRMNKDRPNLFSYKFNLLQQDVTFKITAGSFTSEEYCIKVYPKPLILNFDVRLDYPGYINKPSETIENTGDLIVPEGTLIAWSMFTKDVSTIQFSILGKRISLDRPEGNRFLHSLKIAENTTYSISPLNQYTYRSDSLRYQISVIKDGYPSIFVTESTDSNLRRDLFFKGTIKDDYGFSKLIFNYEVAENQDTANSRKGLEAIEIDNRNTNQPFYYNLDIAALLTQPGQTLTYFFEISDNDGLHGPKRSRTEIRTLKNMTLEEIIAQTDKSAESVRNQMESSLRETKSMKKSIDDINRKMVDQSTLSWKEKKQLEELIKTNENVVERIENIKKLNEENIRNEERFLETSQKIREKQETLNELIDQMFTEEMKRMMQEMREMLDKVDKNKLQDLMEKMKVSNKELEKQLDQNIELYKQIEFERKLEGAVNKLRKLAEEQEKLADKSEKDKMSKEDLVKGQEEIERKFDSLRSDLNKLSKEGMELETPVELKKSEAAQDSVMKALKQSKKALEENKRKQGAKSQKEAAERLNKLAQDLEEMQQETEDEQLEEDASNVRMILENLLRLSFSQEELISDTRIVNRADPRFQEIIVRQKEIKEKIKGVEDSLRSIAKRQVFIQPVISKELTTINSNVQLSLESLDLRNIPAAVIKQQYTMTAINNLANLLSEALNKMNEQQESNMKTKGGQKSCSKPSGKGGKKSMKSLRDLQQKLSDQLEQMKEGMQKSGKQGKSGKGEQMTLNRQLAKMAAQQEALRNELQKYQDGIKEEGQKDGGSLNKAMSEMEEIERDILNKKITAETLNRQKRILTRMLESEKAEQLREKEEKRESTEAKSYNFSNQTKNIQYKRLNQGTNEILRLTDVPLSNFYKTRVNSYLLKITQ